MPIYEYRRPDGTTFEIQQSFSEAPLASDPDTGVPVVRVLHPPAVHFKGKGFYNTDYGTRNRERETAAAGGGSSSENGSSAKDGGSSAKDGSTEGGSGSSSQPASSEGKAKSEKGSGSSPSKESKPAAAKS
jgi:predicted nucleic acid-binding Zn ribbon protein